MFLSGIYNGAVETLGGVVSVPYFLFGGVDSAVDTQNGFNEFFSYNVRSRGAKNIYETITPAAQYVSGKIDSLRNLSENYVGDGFTTYVFASYEAGIGIAATLTGTKGITSIVKSASRVPNSARAVDPQRQALLNAVENAGTLSEKKGIVFGTRQMQAQGFDLLDESFVYRGNQGIDLAFRHTETGQFAILEAKHGSGLGSLSTYEGPLRQGGRDYNIDRLEKYIHFNPNANVNLADDLIYGIQNRTVDSYASFYRGDSLYRLDFDNTVNFRLTPEAAVKVK